MKTRVGFGFDVHPLQEGRDFWIGGIKVPSSKGAVGHSDADVLIHAICDALLGAANLGDIGIHFPNKDPKWAGKDSKYFLKEVAAMLAAQGWKIENVDCTLSLEKPMIKDHIPQMKAAMAPLMQVDESDLSIKATTNEKLGYVGRQDGVNAYAIALISKP
jgi:2-C-methyl-D-erythritol 2,4-cyclodiphosphate synthase